MKRLQQTKEVLVSWRRCIECGLSNVAPFPVLCVDDSVLGIRLKENSLLLSIFEDSIESIDDLITGEYSFLLVDPDGILLKKK